MTDPIFRLIKNTNTIDEAYDVFNGTERVGFIYLRWNLIYAKYPDADGLVVYSEYAKGYNPRVATQRDYYLRHALFNILQYMKGEHILPHKATGVQYTVES